MHFIYIYIQVFTTGSNNYYCVIFIKIFGHCLRKAIVLQATVTTEDSKPDETYVRLTENTNSL